MTEETIDSKTQKGNGFHDFMMSVLIWREKHISERTFVMVLALVVGTTCGFAALILKWLIHTISSALSSHIAINSGNYLYLLFPAIGILLTMLYVRYIVKHNISHGVTRVLYSISQNKSRLKPHNMYTSLLASS
ncbi:MAG: chloride channel protein, partial [Muribaculaceae bacterium]|nr:chloride channel protein [Muribaculaceae bacterium]